MRRLAIGTLLSGVLLLAACGSSGDGDSADSTAAAPATTAAPAATTTVAPAETTAAAPAETTTLAPAETTAAASTETTAAASEAGGTLAVELVEWEVKAPAELGAGSFTVEVTNAGDFAHELLLVAGDGYASLPLDSRGTVDETQLAAGALLGETGRLDSGASASFTVDLTAGDYVLFCNIGGGGQSHAERGQVLEITVI